ncbi:MAG: hypothetical protein RL514_1762 [Verrucomicrobiota bacterium]|jgi:HD-like signal output (HDOD) protein
MSAICVSDPIAEYTAECAHGVDRETLLRFASELPAFPHTAAKLLQLLNDPDAELEAIADTAGTDASVAFAVVKLANSAAFAR